MSPKILVLILLLALTTSRHLQTANSTQTAASSSSSSSRSTKSSPSIPWDVILGIGLPLCVVVGAILGYCIKPLKSRSSCQNLMFGALMGLLILGILYVIFRACCSGQEPPSNPEGIEDVVIAVAQQDDSAKEKINEEDSNKNKKTDKKISEKIDGQKDILKLALKTIDKIQEEDKKKMTSEKK